MTVTTNPHSASIHVMHRSADTATILSIPYTHCSLWRHHVRFKKRCSLAGQTTFVAGGAGVIGRVMPQALLAAGANGVIWSRSQGSVDQALEARDTKTGSAEELTGGRVDTRDESQVQLVLAVACQPFKRPGILVNAVGGNLGYRDHTGLNLVDDRGREDEGILFVDHAGEMRHKLNQGNTT